MNIREQKLEKEVFDVKMELEMKEQEALMLSKLNEELKEKLSEEKHINEDLIQKNDVSMSASSCEMSKKYYQLNLIFRV